MANGGPTQAPESIEREKLWNTATRRYVRSWRRKCGPIGQLLGSQPTDAKRKRLHGEALRQNALPLVERGGLTRSWLREL